MFVGKMRIINELYTSICLKNHGSWSCKSNLGGFKKVAEAA